MKPAKKGAAKPRFTSFPLFLFSVIHLMVLPLPVLASGNIDGKFSQLYSMLEALVTGIGSVMLLWYAFEFGVSMASGEPGGQSRALKGIAGGIFMLVTSAVAKAMGAATWVI